MIAPRLAAHDDGPLLLWQLPEPRLCISSAPLGGGIGLRHWIVNAQVPLDYSRTDVEDHLTTIARALACRGAGVGLLTAAAVDALSTSSEGDVCVQATVGLTKPTWAADADDAVGAWRPGTINVVAFSPVQLSEAALVNAVMTVTEAKTQALLDAGVPGTGTASDAVCIACPASGRAETFGGPRSAIGAPLARATYAAIAARAGGGS